MPDPGFAAALVAELVHRIIVEAEKAYRCKEYCRSLQSLLRDISPLVTHAVSQSSPSTAVDQWLWSLKSALDEAEKAVQECTKKNRLMNPFLRYNTATKILKIADKIRSLCVQSPLVVLDVTLSIQQKLETGMKKMHEDQRRMELAMATRTALTNVDLSCNPRAKELAFNEIKRCVDNVSNGQSLTSATSSSIQGGQQHQLVPQAVFGMDDITQKLKAMVLDGKELVAGSVGIWGKGGAGKTLLAQQVNNDREIQQVFPVGAL